jgi:CheY-like chemotaxis protein
MPKTILNAAALTVMVVDDDEFSQQILLGILHEFGVTDVHLASGGRDALRLLDSLPRPPDFVICDVYMPGMDGIEFSTQLASRKFSGGLILLTGGDRVMLDIARDLAFAEGLRVLSTFTKPVNHLALAQTMGLR